ncbi:hypothetical protein KFL_000730120 [Klebsormidium nitens]|uniref:Uncharacterized protein n=1 Tax=Klebsormidium nitens TaxID=105231 RepID=A0A1Y1HRA3_KLENI|nr:hypothetical protein KFL_000730120 [Klebsormidium nitens]|eukprot:GAQ81175.1 hypothetical protein KFL_000730120 [Klebsormidium nitens]
MKQKRFASAGVLSTVIGIIFVCLYGVGFSNSRPNSVRIRSSIVEWANGTTGSRDRLLELSSVPHLEELAESIIPALFAPENYQKIRQKFKGNQFLLRKPIPVVGIPVMNNAEWLRRTIYSIDVPVKKIQLVVNELPSASEENRKMKEAVNDIVTRLGSRFVHVEQPGCNLGVSGSWNTIFAKNLDAPWFFLASADVAFAPAALGRVADEVEDPQNKDILIYFYSAMRFFVLTRKALDVIGVFDENIWPHPVEDKEYHKRVMRAQVLQPDKQLMAQIGAEMPNGRIFEEIHHVHGNDEVIGRGRGAEIWEDDDAPKTSGAFRTNPELYAKRLKMSGGNVGAVYRAKWSTLSDEEEKKGIFNWMRPFNNPERELWSWTFDRKLRAILMSMWNMDLDPSLNSLEPYNYARMMPGDQLAKPRSNWDAEVGDRLYALLPREGMGRESDEFIKAQGDVCVSEFAAVGGDVNKLLESRQM